jgi:acid phosphatase family membrane protein YuiD
MIFNQRHNTAERKRARRSQTSTSDPADQGRVDDLARLVAGALDLGSTPACPPTNLVTSDADGEWTTLLLSKNEHDKRYVHCYGDDSVRVEPLLYYNKENIDRLGGAYMRPDVSIPCVELVPGVSLSLTELHVRADTDTRYEASDEGTNIVIGIPLMTLVQVVALTWVHGTPPYSYPRAMKNARAAVGATLSHVQASVAELKPSKLRDHMLASAGTAEVRDEQMKQLRSASCSALEGAEAPPEAMEHLATVYAANAATGVTQHEFLELAGVLNDLVERVAQDAQEAADATATSLQKIAHIDAYRRKLQERDEIMKAEVDDGNRAVGAAVAVYALSVLTSMPPDDVVSKLLDVFEAWQQVWALPPFEDQVVEGRELLLKKALVKWMEGGCEGEKPAWNWWFDKLLRATGDLAGDLTDGHEWRFPQRTSPPDHIRVQLQAMDYGVRAFKNWRRAVCGQLDQRKCWVPPLAQPLLTGMLDTDPHLAFKVEFEMAHFIPRLRSIVQANNVSTLTLFGVRNKPFSRSDLGTLHGTLAQVRHTCTMKEVILAVVAHVGQIEKLTRLGETGEGARMDALGHVTARAGDFAEYFAPLIEKLNEHPEGVTRSRFKKLSKHVYMQLIMLAMLSIEATPLPLTTREQHSAEAAELSHAAERVVSFPINSNNPRGANGKVTWEVRAPAIAYARIAHCILRVWLPYFIGGPEATERQDALLFRPSKVLYAWAYFAPGTKVTLAAHAIASSVAQSVAPQQEAVSEAGPSGGSGMDVDEEGE